MEHLILEDTAIIMPFLQISVVPITRELVSMLILPSLEGSCAKAVVCIHPTALKFSTNLASASWLHLCHQWPYFSFWTWCFFMVHLALTLGFLWKNLAWLWTGSSSEHPEYDDFLRSYSPFSNKLDQQQAALTGQMIQLMQKTVEKWGLSSRFYQNFELMQNNFP